MMIRPALTAALLAFATPALADPCEAPLPKPGAVFSGSVVYVGDGDSLCVDVGPTLEQSSQVRAGSWIEVRLADLYAPELHSPGGPEAKRTLERIAMGRRVTCVAQHRSYDRIVASCTLNGRSLGDRMRAAGVPEGGRGLGK